MSDLRSVLQRKFEIGNRFQNFGAAITQMEIHGFRCHENTVIDIQSPITAFCGLNGTGKSTLLHLAAVSTKKEGERSFYLRDFFIVGPLDPSPFRHDAKVVYKFWQEDRTEQKLTLSRSRTSWSGYKRRPERAVLFAGVGVFLPKVERRDFSVYQASRIQVDGRDVVDLQIRTAASRILGRNYTVIENCHVSCGLQSRDVLAIHRGESQYSEAHMGFGEGRATYLVTALESLPDKSLVLIEEPETSLHPSAQFEFGKFLVDVSARKGHQIFLTTHSEYLLRALPSVSRTCLFERDGVIRKIVGLTAAEANSLMTNGFDKALTVLVEDDCAKAIITEMVRKHDPIFLKTICVSSAGGHQQIRTTMRCLEETGLTVACVLDGDQTPQARENIFVLPGTEPPEKEIFACAAVQQHLDDSYSFQWEDFYATAGLETVDHHEWFDRVAAQLAMEKSSLISELARVYAGVQDYASLSNLLREAIN